MRNRSAWLLVCALESNLVETALTAHDARGQPVAGLQASDFEALDSGNPRRIVSFHEADETPVGQAFPPGRFQLRAVVREGMKANLAAISAPVECR